MAKKSKQKNNIKIIWVVAIAVVVLFFLLLMRFGGLNKATAPVSPSIMPSLVVFKTYHSDFLDITIDVPSNFTIKERLPETLLENDNGVITLNKIGTNRSYKDIKEFLDESYNSSNLSKEITRQQININGIDCEAVVGKYIHQPDLNNKSYYCYRNSNSFLSFSTTYPELYADLDKIVSSFRYESSPTR